MAEINQKLLQLLDGIGETTPEHLMTFLERMGTESRDEDEKIKKMMQENSEKKRMEAEIVCREIKSIFEENDWKYSEVSQHDIPIYILNFSMRNLNIALRIIVEYESECIRFDVSLPITCKHANRMILAYKLVELNHPLRYGAFHMDYNDNELSHRYSFPYYASAFSKSTCELIIYAMMRTADRYYEDITKYAFGTIDEKEKNKVLLMIKDNVISLR